MTTEIAILNRSAIALATDSAVTISSVGPGVRIQKIYANANKLFELIKGRPVGIMIYNNADLSGIPWETLIKAFRGSQYAQPRNSLEDYVRDFLDFVREAVCSRLTPEVSDRELIEQLTTVVAWLLRGLEREVFEIKKLVDRRKKIFELVTDLSTSLSEVPKREWSQEVDEDATWAQVRDRLVTAMPDQCCSAKLPPALKLLIGRTALAWLLKGDQPVSALWSGVVIAGFGEEDLFPSLFEVTINGVVDGKLVRLQDSTTSVSPERPSIIKPYAQTSEADMFLQGIDPEISAGITEFWRAWTKRVRGDVSTIAKAVFTEPPASQVSELSGKIAKYIDESVSQFENYMKTQFYEPRTGPIEGSAAFLSKGEIADLAENLVELTSLRNRVSLDRQETVGGATDVAVISKGDGFVWIKRKHYFERDRNPIWGVRQALADVLLVQARQEGGRGDGLDQR